MSKQLEELIDQLSPGRRLKVVRVALGIKQNKLAETVGITPSQLSRIEDDESPLEVTIAHRAAQAMNVDYTVFIGEQKEAA